LAGGEAAAGVREVDWDALLADYAACVDWPAAAFWRQLLWASPDALVLLSARETPQRWWASMEKTIVVALNTPAAADDPGTARRRAVTRHILATRLTPAWENGAAAI